jgi:spermidine/putrescine transport system substrate-binding protein
MNRDKLIAGLRSGRWTRRDFNRALASVGLTAVAMPVFTRTAQAQAGHPVIFTWEGYEDEGLHQGYLDKHGASPSFTFFGDEEEAFAKIRTGFNVDISMPCSYKIPQWRDAGILRPIDESRIEHWDDIIPSLKSIEGVVHEGNRYWVCMDWGQTSIIYRHDLVELEEESWGLLWDERYRGRLSLMDSLIDGVMVAAIYGGAADPFNMTDEEVERTRELLRQQLPLLRGYFNSPTDIQQALASGEVVAAVAWNEAYNNLAGEGVPVTWMQPKEGAMTWTCGLALMANIPDEKVDLAYDFINAMLSPEAGEYEILEWGYGHANAKAFENVSDEDLAARGLSRDPETLLASGIFQEPIGNEPQLQTMFEEVKAGL